MSSAVGAAVRLLSGDIVREGMLADFELYPVRPSTRSVPPPAARRRVPGGPFPMSFRPTSRRRRPPATGHNQVGMRSALIFDVDGVVVDSPHEEAWGETLAEILAAEGVPYDRAQYTSALYQAHVAGKPRYDGAAALLAAVGVPDPDHELARKLGAQKQIKIEQMIEQGRFAAYADALRLIDRARAAGWRLAAASSSQNANAFLAKIETPEGALIQAFDANVCGQRFEWGKPAPDIFLAAAHALGAEPVGCVVVEDAPAGIEAATAAGMSSVGIARSNDADLLAAAGATWVVESLDDVDLTLLAENP